MCVLGLIRYVHAYMHAVVVMCRECALVIDIGSHTVRAGFAGDDYPIVVVPMMVSRAKHKGVMAPYGRERWASEDAVGRLGAVYHPVRRGEFVHWDNWEQCLHNILYKELRVAPEEHPVLITRPPRCNMPFRHVTIQVYWCRSCCMLYPVAHCLPLCGLSCSCRS